MKFLIPSIFILMLVGIVIGITAWSADTGTVSAKVQVSQYSVEVGDGYVNYGLLALNATASTVGTDTQIATNDGNQAEKLEIMGYDSSPDSWLLLSTQGTNQYFHKFSTDGGSAWTAIATSGTGYTTLFPSIDPDATDDFDLMIGVPTTTSATSTQDVNVIVHATSP